MILDEHKRALQYYNKSIELNPSYGPAYQERKKIHLKLKDYANAIKDISKLQ